MIHNVDLREAVATAAGYAAQEAGTNCECEHPTICNNVLYNV